MTAPLSAPNDRRGQGYRNRHYIQSIISPNQQLVYVRTLKCASTFFYNNLQFDFGWKEIPWIDIQWNNHHVFGHILEPIKRRHKGMAECITMLNLQEQFWTNENFRTLVNNSLPFDPHSLSLFDTYGPACWSIDWIPLTGDYEQNIAHTEILLQTYGYDYKHIWNKDYEHKGDQDKKDLEEAISALWKIEIPEHCQHYFHKDMELYKQVVHDFNPSAGEWSDISWLTTRRY